MAEGLDENLTPRQWSNAAPGASLPAQAASVQPSPAEEEGWVVGTPWEQCWRGAVESPGPSAEMLPSPCHWRSLKKGEPGLPLVLLNDLKVAVFRAGCDHRQQAAPLQLS